MLTAMIPTLTSGQFLNTFQTDPHSQNLFLDDPFYYYPPIPFFIIQLAASQEVFQPKFGVLH
jgi:hypothetical protein